MSSLTNAAETSLLQLLMQAVAWADIADNDATSPQSQWRYSLHTGSPGDTGSQTTSEAAHAPYARVSVARTTAGHTVTNDTASPAATVAFAACTSGTATVTHMGIGKATSGAGYLLMHGAVSPNISVAAGVTPQLGTGSTIVAA